MTPSLAWAYHQTWIDAVAIMRYSPGSAANEGAGEALDRLAGSGRPVFVSTGNNAEPTHFTDGVYPAASIAVGAAYPDWSIHW